MILEKKATRADRARKRIQLHSECVFQTFTSDGKCVVEATKKASIKRLKKLGFTEALPGEAPPLSHTEASLMSLVRKDQNGIAKGLGLKGYTKMDEAELVTAILAAQN